MAGEERRRCAKVAELDPDLVLMDIHLRGGMDGVEAAEAIHNRFDVPVVYLTAYADPATVGRARVTEPYGYVLKPFEERELHVVIEMALYRHRMARKLKESERWLAATLRSIGDGVIAVDGDWRVRFMNPVAERLTGWRVDDAIGRELAEVLRVSITTPPRPLPRGRTPLRRRRRGRRAVLPRRARAADRGEQHHHPQRRGPGGRLGHRHARHRAPQAT